MSTLSEVAPAPILSIRELSVEIQAYDQRFLATKAIGLDLCQGEVLGLVGESGCGKTLTCKAIMGLLPEGIAKVQTGEVLFAGHDLTRASRTTMQEFRGNTLSMIFQDPLNALNPVLTIGEQLAEVLKTHTTLKRKEIYDEALLMLRRVGLPDAARRMRAYPHELSGGMRQRVVIAMALLMEPDVIIADEPTTALDVTVQAHILKLLKSFQRNHNTAILLVTHDLGVIAEMCDRVAVMYAGRIVETGTTEAIFDHPSHPYTAKLLEASPRGRPVPRGELSVIPGIVPSDPDSLSGCKFAPRCDRVQEACRGTEPQLKRVREGSTRIDPHLVSCFIAFEEAEGAQYDIE